MSNQWNSGQFQSGLPSQGTQVRMFDPTQFQAPAAPGGTLSGKPRLHTRQQSGAAPVSQHAPPLAAAQPSWNSWNTWDWNSESAGTQGVDQQQQQQSQQSQQQQSQQSQQQQSQQPQQHNSSVAGGTQYYSDNQFTNAWNQGWDGSRQYSQPNQAYAPSDASVAAYQGQELHQHQQQQQQPQQQQQQSHWAPTQQDSGTYGQGQYEGSIYGQQHYASSPASQQQENLQNQQIYGQQQGQQEAGVQGQVYQQIYGQQQGQQEAGGQGQVYQQIYGQQEAGGQGQVCQQGYEQYQAHPDAGYSDPYGASTWTASGGGSPWVSGNRDQPTQLTNATDAGLNAVSEQQHSYSLQNPTSQSLPPSSSVQHSSGNMALPGSSLEVYTADDDDDGTVSGFFGKDDDGDTLDSQRHGYSYSLDNPGGGSFGLNNPLAEAHRTGYEVAGGDVSTFSASSSRADAGSTYSHTAQNDLLTHRERDEQNTSLPGQFVGGSSLGDQYQVDASIHHSHDAAADFIQRQPRGELRDAFHSPPTLPLNTNIRPASPDGDHPGSSGSGGSGGSSGLTDWEIVPPQSGSLTPGHNSSLGGSMVLDKPDGSASMSHSYSSVEHPVQQQPQGSPAHNYLTPSSAEPASSSSQTWDSLQHPPVYDSSSTTACTSAQPSHEPSGHLGRAPIVISGQQTGDNSLHPPQPTVQLQTPALISGNTNVSLPSVPQPDSAANPFRKDIGRGARHAGAPQFVNPQTPLSNTSLASRGPANPAEYKTAVATNQNLDSQKYSDATAITSAKTKLLSNSSTEDGNCGSKRDSDPATNTTKNTSFNAKDASMVSQQQHHHSAFHPVGRQQKSVSPSASPWDSAEAPTPNILLAPVVPLIIAAMNPYSVSAQQTGGHSTVTSSSASRVSGQEQTKAEQETTKAQSRTTDKKEERSREQRERERHHPREEEEEENRSFDSLDEIDSVAGRHVRSYGNEQREHKEASSVQKYERRGEPGRNNPDNRTSRTNPAGSQHDRDDRYYDRPSSRTDRYPKDEDYRQHHGYHRDYKDDALDERYDRPRSRQDESFGSRPSSRSGQEAAVTRSRADYNQDKGYYDRGTYKGYGYDSYSRNLDYYNEERERYYRYNKEKEARLARAYYEEYYGAKYAEYYKQLQQHHLHQQQLQQQQGGRLSSQEFDRSSSHSQSRGSTPAVGPSPGPEQYGSLDSRPDSRTDYSRDYYNKGYSYEGHNAYYDGYGYDPYAYRYGYPGSSEYDQANYQGRMTPPKHSYPHVRACFGPSGQLVKVLPNRPKDGQPALVEVQDIQTVLENCPEAEELRLFPGPLARNSTHKKDVLLFCQEKARACADNINMVDRESAQLIWKFLELLIKQNGSAVGTDLSDLLLEGHEPSTHEYSLPGVRLSQSPHSLDTVPEGNSEDGSSRESPAVRVTSDRTVINSADGERENWVDRFRHLLLYGRKKDALECAMKNNLWGHALFLASKLDARTHANVMSRFANSAMRMNDPLQTLYQLMSGRQPAAVTCVLDERWGDWRPHLAMILSNQSSKSDIHRKSISTLGDTLASKGYLYASHFCYLMAQVSFGNYFNKTSKIVLIGSSHNLSMEEFAANEAIQCTEVYEYAQALGNSTYCLPHLQIYKYLYACRLADYGMVSEALAYCEVIANNILQNPAWYQAPFVRLVCQMSRKLQFADPQLQMSGDEGESQAWIQQLEDISAAFEDGSIQSLPGAVTQTGFSGPSGNSESEGYSQVGYGSVGDTAPAAGVSTDMMYGQQLQALGVSSTGQDGSAMSGQLQNLSITDQSLQQMYGQHHGYAQQQEYNQHQQGYGQPDNSQLQQPQEYSQQQQYDYSHWQQQQQQQQQYGSQLDPSSSSIPQTSQGYGGYMENQHQLPARASVSTNELSEDDDDDVDGAGDEHVLGGSAAGFDYFGNVGGQKVVAPPHRYRTTSGSSTGSVRRRRTMSGSSTGSVKAAPHKPPSQQQLAGGKGGDKPGQQGNAGGGWFGGFFNKLKPKGKNEMILPDDKDPAIVWDPATKKWMNADGTEEVATPQPPPPKDTDLLGHPSAAASPPLGPGRLTTSNSAGSNKFSLKATGPRNQYVDISNTKPLSLSENVLSAGPETDSALASSNLSTGTPQMYTQGSTGAPQMYTQGSTGAPQMYTQGSTGAPQMYTQGSTGAPQMYPQVSGHADTRNVDSVHREPSSSFNLASHNTDMPQSGSAVSATTSQPTASMPVLFNPAAVNSGTSTSTPAPTSTARPGLKYGQRRAYPK